jgi:hypothetical protein
MRKHKYVPALTISIMIMAGTATLMALQGQTKPKHDKQSALVLRRQDQNALSPSQQEIRDQLPIADAFSPDIIDQKQKEKREKKNARHDNMRTEAITEAPYPLTVTQNTHWWTSLPALPVTESDVIVVGEVSEARAFLSNDRTGIYSEFKISVGEVLKNNTSSPIVAGMDIEAERSGGAVRFPSGAVQKYVIADQHMPLVRRKYLFFFKGIEDHDFSIITAYELGARHVVPLDGARNANGRLPFDKYTGSDVSWFLDLIRDAIVKVAKGASL